jgi:LPS sulfotransferase NodH
MDKLTDVFPELRDYSAADFAALASSKPVLMMAITPRTGSTNLCDAYSRSLKVGEPVEIFNPRGVAQWQKKKRGVADFRSYMMSLYADPGEWFGFKVSWPQFGFFVPYYKLMFPNLKVVYLDRYDVEAQAVSLFKAVVSGEWHKKTGSDAGRKMAPEELDAKFDLQQICQTIRNVEAGKKQWRSFFFDEGIYPAYVYYEDFAKDVNRAIEYIVKFIGVDYSSCATVESQLSQLADEINENWVKRVNKHRLGK